MKNFLSIFFLFVIFFNAQSSASDQSLKVELIVLGVAQDAGYPQINCYQAHCIPGWQDHSKRKLATSLAVVDRKNKQKYLFEATPDIKQQMYLLHQAAPDLEYKLSGIFLTHAHMGHYTGLMHLGREAAGTKNIPVYAMPKMRQFLTSNGPWSQLVKLNNIQLMPLINNKKTSLNNSLHVTPLIVPHRDEYSETVGFLIEGPNKIALFIPDIDKWQKWKTNIAELVQEVDYALLDATFFENGELPNRDMSEVPHPFVEETMSLLNDLSMKDKSKVIFIHFNHSNPLLKEKSQARRKVVMAGFRYATEGMKL
ncbi:MAG: MBL fold metallo-hydrolase, partial [Kangiellaceae bacterium]|nr:MBL fold metallo-hydrolase [Kangiellaceae bacterium]